MGREAASVRVICRSRPPNAREKSEEESAAASSNNGAITAAMGPMDHLRAAPGNKQAKDSANLGILTLSRDLRSGRPLVGKDQQHFPFDAVFAPQELCSGVPKDSDTDSQETVFARAACETVDDVISGFNGTLFAYGQTGSGKSHTMFGSVSLAAGDAPAGSGAEIPAGWGVIPRAIQRIFDYIEAGRVDSGDKPLYPKGTEFFVRCSFLEVYKEVVRDLLSPAPPTKGGLRVREAPSRGVWVDGLSEHCVADLGEALNLIRVGEKSRSVAATGMNATSSRSHSLFVVELHQRFPDGSSKTGRLNLADLAGSEKVCSPFFFFFFSLSVFLLTYLMNYRSARLVRLEKPWTRRVKSTSPCLLSATASARWPNRALADTSPIVTPS
jgi:Kinesin motor domain